MKKFKIRLVIISIVLVICMIIPTTHYIMQDKHYNPKNEEHMKVLANIVQVFARDNVNIFVEPYNNKGFARYSQPFILIQEGIVRQDDNIWYKTTRGNIDFNKSELAITLDKPYGYSNAIMTQHHLKKYVRYIDWDVIMQNSDNNVTAISDYIWYYKLNIPYENISNQYIYNTHKIRLECKTDQFLSLNNLLNNYNTYLSDTENYIIPINLEYIIINTGHSDNSLCFSLPYAYYREKYDIDNIDIIDLFIEQLEYIRDNSDLASKFMKSALFMHEIPFFYNFMSQSINYIKQHKDEGLEVLGFVATGNILELKQINIWQGINIMDIDIRQYGYYMPIVRNIKDEIIYQ